METKISVTELNALLLETKPIWSNPITVTSANWVVFSEGRFYCTNGVFHYSTECTYMEAAVPASDIHELIRKYEDGEVVIDAHDSSVNISIKIPGRKAIQASFDYPFEFKNSLDSFYDEENISTDDIEGFSNALQFTSQYVFRDNIEYSNVYVVNGNAVATDGYCIAKSSVTCPDTSLVFGLSKVLNGLPEPERVFQNSSSITFYHPDYKLSCAKAMGKPTAVTDYIPDVSKLKRDFSIGNVDDFCDIITSLKRLSDFKKQDKFVVLESNGTTLDVFMDNVSKTYRYPIENATVNSSFSMKIHPDHIVNLLRVSPTVRYETSESFVYAFDSELKRNLVVWVEYEENST